MRLEHYICKLPFVSSRDESSTAALPVLPEEVEQNSTPPVGHVKKYIGRYALGSIYSWFDLYLPSSWKAIPLISGSISKIKAFLLRELSTVHKKRRKLPCT